MISLEAPASQDAATAPGSPFGCALHATAVAVNGRAFVIRGTSGSGKSTLALALITASRPGRRIILVGDDRILLSVRGDGLVIARPHPRTAGFIERRGLGLVAMPWRGQAPVVGRIELGHIAEPVAMARATDGAMRLLKGLPVLRLPRGSDRSLVLDWWREAAEATDRSHPPRKQCPISADRAK